MFIAPAPGPSGARTRQQTLKPGRKMWLPSAGCSPIQSRLPHGVKRLYWPRFTDNPRRLLKLPALRSEEHTSELQSRENLVCRLLLEKKKPQYARACDY